MTNNIFKDAKFGDKFQTRDGRKAIYFINGQCIVEGELAIHSYCSDGGYTVHGIECGLDIVSEWHDEINEEELDELAYNICNNKIKGEQGFVDDDIYVLERGFTAGYRKAKEN